MIVTDWHKAESNAYPVLLDKESSSRYVIVRRNVTTTEHDGIIFYEYDEKMIPRADWNVYEDVLSVTPYTESKTAYIDDTEVTFADVPQGNLTVYFESNGGYPNYNVSRNGDRVTITFEPLEYIGTVTISVQ